MTLVDVDFILKNVGDWLLAVMLKDDDYRLVKKLRGRHILIEEEGGSWLLEEEAYCWKWRLAHGR